MSANLRFKNRELAEKWSALFHSAQRNGLLYLLDVAAIAAIYFGSAKLGLTMAFVAEQVTAVWPPTGIALAVILLFGARFWPGVFLGAFLANVTTNAPPRVACGIAVGNTLEALLGALLLRHVVRFNSKLERLKDVLGLVALAAVLSPMVSATVGVSSLCAGGLQSSSDFGSLWWVWWLGDATSALVFAPLVLCWFHAFRVSWKPFRVAETTALLLAVVVVSLVVFAGGFASFITDHPLEYTIFPFVIWAAFRFGQPVTTMVTVLASSIAIWGTLNGLGPFTARTVNESLNLLQTFTAVVAVTGLLLGAAITERNAEERRRAADYAVSQILGESTAVSDAIPRILKTICECLDWDMGTLWSVDQSSNSLRCVEIWHQPARNVAEFAAMSRKCVFPYGVALPGRVWATAAATWLSDIVAEKNSPRAAFAAQKNIHGAFGFPIVLAGKALGIVEFFSHEIRDPDHDLLRMFATVGNQIGQFIDRREAEQKLRERAAELAEADRRKDEFLAMLAHELRNPLAPIRSALELLKAPNADDAACEHAREVMDRQLQHMVRLVDDLLDVSRITSGKIQIRTERVDIAKVITRAIETARPVIDEHRHVFEVSMPIETIYVEGDETRLAQVVSNLLNNAAKYTDEGGRIWLTVRHEENEVVIRVRDTGVGISPEMLPHIFGLFTQVDRSLARSQGGLGIGLTLVRSLVEMHGGLVHASSGGSGQGSEFTVRLPVLSVPEPKKTPATSDNAFGRKGLSCRILVVDDNVDAAESLAKLLRISGHETHTAYDGSSALEAARAFLPEVVLLDIGLPGMNGYEVARQIRGQPGLENVVLAAVTGYGQEEYRQQAQEAGINHHFTKPVDPQALEKMLSRS